MNAEETTIVVRRGGAQDVRFLRDMLHHAYYWKERAPDSGPGPVALYVKAWGRPGDTAVIAIEKGFPVGAAWYRLFGRDRPGYGFVDERTPELAIAVVPNARGKGVGSALLDALLGRARAAGYPTISLSVDRANAGAIELYERHGFGRWRRTTTPSRCSRTWTPRALNRRTKGPIPHERRRRRPRRRSGRIHGRDPRRPAGRQGRVHRAGARARGHLPARGLHPDEGLGAERARLPRRAGDVREARRPGRGTDARLRHGRRVEGRRRRPDDRGHRVALQGERRRVGEGRRAPSRARTRSRSRAPRRSSFTSAIVATGSFPMRPPIPGIDSPRCVDSTGLLVADRGPAAGS